MIRRPIALAAGVAIASFPSVGVAQAPPRYTVQVIAPLGGRPIPTGATPGGSTVVGYVETGDAWTAFSWRDSNLTPLTALPGHADTYADDVSPSGIVVGAQSNYMALTDLVPVAWVDGQARVLPALNGTRGWAHGVNATGQIVGWSSGDALSRNRATLWENGVAIDLGVLPGHAISVAHDISDSGYIGGMSAGDGGSRPVLWVNGMATELPLPDASSFGGIVSAVNNAGQAVGYVFDQQQQHHAALWSNGSMIDLGAHFGGFTTASDINNAGDVVGSNGIAAFLWRDGVVHDLNALVDLGPYNFMDTAMSITDDGVITGTATINGLSQAVVLTPVPAAPTFAAILLPMSLAAARRRRR